MVVGRLFYWQMQRLGLACDRWINRHDFRSQQQQIPL